MEQYGVKEYFERFGNKVEMKRGTSICNPKLSDSYIYYLVNGIASLTSLTRDGEEKDFIYIPQDHLLGFAPALMRYYRRAKGEQVGEPADIPYGIAIKTDCVFYRLSERNFDRLIAEEVRFLGYILEAVTRNYVALVKKYHDSQEECASNRLYKWLLNFSTEEGDHRVVPRGFTYAEIAKYLGMHPVTVSKLASGLKKEMVIKKEKGHIIIIDEIRLRGMIRM